MSEFMKQKLTSRKFWLSVCAFLTSFGSGIAGLVAGNQTLMIIGSVCCLLSSSIYASLEAYVDKTRIENEIKG